MEINRIIEDDISIFDLSGNLLGEKDAGPIYESISKSLENDSKLFVFNLEKLEYINSTGLSVLLTALTKSRNAGGDLVLINMNDSLKKLLDITKLADVFSYASSKEDAITLLKNK